jgi:hypothetical protein
MAVQQLLAAYGSSAPAFTYATWNPADTSADIALSGGNLVATRNAGGGWRSSRATQSKNAGKWYFELSRTAGSDKAQSIYGLMTAASGLSEYPGQVISSAGAQALNTVDVNLYTNGFAGTFGGQSDVPIGGGFQIAVDMGTRKVWVKTFGAAGWIGGGDPAAGTSQTFLLTGTDPIFPAIGHNLAGVEVTANFGASAFTGTVPSGFNAGWYT